jgi:hypothetical protein
MAELLPCPFCGGEPYDYAIEPHSHSPALRGLGIPDHAGSHVIECGCGAGLIADTHAEVATVWNRRATPAEGAQSQDAQDARRYRAFFESGLPVCFRGDEFYSKTECDSAIDAAIERSDKGSLAALGEQGK